MTRAVSRCALTIAIALVAGPSQAVFVYPEKGQSQEQQNQDEGACMVWARQQTGFDPAQGFQPTSAPPPQEAPRGGLVRGGARGAAVGAVGGAIGGDAGRGAAIGAASGALIGGMRRRDQVRQEQYAQDQWAGQQSANYQQQLASYNQAYATCLRGRGYSVSG